MKDFRILRLKKDFDAIYKRGKSVGDRYVVIFYKRNGLGYNRMAFVASKKVGNAVARNRARRLMKESIRTMDPCIKEGYDTIFIARKTIDGKKCPQVASSIAHAIAKTEMKI